MEEIDKQTSVHEDLLKIIDRQHDTLDNKRRLIFNVEPMSTIRIGTLVYVGNKVVGKVVEKDGNIVKIEINEEAWSMISDSMITLGGVSMEMVTPNKEET